MQHIKSWAWKSHATESWPLSSIQSHRGMYPPEPMSYQVKNSESVRENTKCTPIDAENSENLNKIRKI